MQNHSSSALSRDRKGFNFEDEVVKPLDDLGVKFKSNSVSSFEDWQKNKGRGPDIILPDTEVECKFLSKYHNRVSWIKRDYISRFSFAEGIDRIVVTNYKWYIGRDAREELYKNDIKLMDREEFIMYVMDKLRRGTNTEVFLSYVDSSVNMVFHRNGYVVCLLSDYFDG